MITIILRDLGVRLVINMRFDWRPPKDPHQPPLEFLMAANIRQPGTAHPRPFFDARRLCRTCRRSGKAGKVYVHCARGRHRGVAMGAAILIALGYDPQEAVELIKVQRPIADPDAFYIRRRILRFAQVWSHC